MTARRVETVRRATQRAWWPTLATLAALYWAAGALSLRLAFHNASASAIWLPSGIAVAVTLLLGYRVWPAWAAGAAIVNVQVTGNPWTILAIAAGNTGEALLAAWLVRRGGDRPENWLASVNSVLGFVAAGLLAAVVAATVGVGALAAGGLDGAPARTWLTWWLGDVAGFLVAAPAILVLARPVAVTARSWNRAAEVAAIATVAVATSGFVMALRQPLAYLMLPPMLWASIRFGTAGAAFVVPTVALVSVAGTIRGRGPFARPDEGVAILLLAGFVVVVAAVNLLLGAVVQRQRRDEATLEARVRERTRELEGSRAALQLAQSVAHVGSWEWEVRRNVVLWSDEMYRVFGLEPRSVPITYESFLERVHPEDRARVAAEVGSAFASGGRFSFEHRAVRPDGTIRTLQAHGRAVRGADGTVVSMHGTGQDVTERKRLEERLELFIEGSPDAMVIVDSEGQIVRVNERAESMLGYQRAELLGQNVDLLVPDGLRRRHASHRGTYAREPRTRPMGANLDLHARRKDGQLIPVEISLSPIETDEGVLVSSTIRDVSERRRAQQESAELERLRGINEFKTQFLNIASHELNTPLTPIKAQLYVMEHAFERLDDEARRRAIQLLARNFARMEQLVLDLLEAARVQSDRLRLEPRRVDVDALVREATDSYLDAAMDANVSLVAQTHAGAADADPARLSQVLYNLVGNALKFTPPGGRVRIWASGNDTDVHISVEDSGVGLTADQIGRLFQPFVQLHRATGPRHGTGLGLYISRAIVEAHGGRIWAESAGRAKGAVFHVVLPRQRRPAKDAARGRARRPQPPGTSGLDPSVQGAIAQADGGEGRHAVASGASRHDGVASTKP